MNIEPLADHCHEQWCNWMEYMFSKCNRNEDGTMTIPQWAVERWEKQLRTPYPKLSKEEKDSYRLEAREILKVIKSMLVED